MKKRLLYSVLLVLFVAASAFMLTRIKKPGYKVENIYGGLLPRKTSLAYAAEWEIVKNNVEVLIRKINENPSDIKSLVALTAQYIQEARNTGNFNYYNAVAFKCINAFLEKDPKNFEALTFKATILLSEHRFTDALIVAAQAQQLYPYNAYVYGLLVDGYIKS